MYRLSKIAIYLMLLFSFVFYFGCQSEGTTQQDNTTTSPQQVQNQPPISYWSGDGGKGMRLGILVPQAQGLSDAQNYLPSMVQGVLVSTISKYSAISVLDRVSLDKVIAETEDLTYQDNSDIVRLGEVAQVGDMMTGTIIQTSSGYTLQINVTDTSTDAKTVASYSGTCTVAELDNHMAIQKASLDLLTQMGVTLTAQARQELSGAAAENSVIAQTALAKGITAQKQGTEVAALSYYFQAAAFDSSLVEAADRSSILNANISSGNIGNDVRNDIQWRKDWVARLTETEQFFDSFNKSQSMPYTLFYISNEIKQGDVNYQNETVTLSLETYLHGSGIWTLSIERALQAVWDGLNATGRKDTWGLGNWPGQGVTNLNAFASRSGNFSVVFELLNNQNKVIGTQTLRTGGSWGLNWTSRAAISVSADTGQTLYFQNVNANDITDNLTIQIASVNGIDAQIAAQNGILQMRAITRNEYDKNGRYWFERGEIRGFTNDTARDAEIVVTPRHTVKVNFLMDDTIPEDRKLTIPGTIWGDPVISIGTEAFKQLRLTSLIIPDNVISISAGAFRNNNFVNIVIPNSVRSIGKEAFWGNNSTADSGIDGISSITIGANVTMDGDPFRIMGLKLFNVDTSIHDISAFQDYYAKNNKREGTYTWGVVIQDWKYNANS